MVGVGTDVELWAENGDFVAVFTGSISRGAKGDFDGIEERVFEGEEELACSEDWQCVEIEQWKLGGRGGLERLEGDGGNVVKRYEPDAKTRALDFGFWFDEDVAACFTALAALCAESGLGGAKVGGESWRMFLFRTLGGACGAGPALCAQFFYSGCVGRRIEDS